MSILQILPNTHFVVCLSLNNDLIPLKMSDYVASQHSREKSYDFSTTTYEKATKFDKPSDFFNLPIEAKNELKKFLTNKELTPDHVKLIKIEFTEPKQTFYQPKIEDFIL